MPETPARPDGQPRKRGRPSRGQRCETKLPPEVMAEVEALIGVLGSDRSEVIAALVRAGLDLGKIGH